MTNFGLFVQLTRFQIEGLVHVTSLDSDYYRHDPIRHRLVGERNGKVFGLTDAVKVEVADVDMEHRRIDFKPAGERQAGGSDRRRTRNKPAGKDAKAARKRSKGKSGGKSRVKGKGRKRR